MKTLQEQIEEQHKDYKYWIAVHPVTESQIRKMFWGSEFLPTP